MSDLAKFLESAAEQMAREQASLPKPIASIWFSVDGKSLEVYLDTSKDTYSEWIKGEGADIGLHRDQESKRVCGAHLPLCAKTIYFGGDTIPSIRVDVESGTIAILPPLTIPDNPPAEPRQE